MRKGFLILSLFVILISCNQEHKESPEWAGRYFGMLPCQGCYGIQTQMELRGDSTFVYKVRKLTHSTAPVHTTEGRIKRDGDRIIIENVVGDSVRHEYILSDGALTKTDNRGREFDPSQQSFYTLLRDDDKIQNKFWRLTHVSGNDISNLRKKTGTFNAHLYVKESDEKVYGNGGCNSFTGHFFLDIEKQIIRMSRFAHTNITCQFGEIEKGMFGAIKNTTFYDVKDDQLILKNSSNEPVARFILDFFQVNPYATNMKF